MKSSIDSFIETFHLILQELNLREEKKILSTHLPHLGIFVHHANDNRRSERPEGERDERHLPRQEIPSFIDQLLIGRFLVDLQFGISLEQLPRLLKIPLNVLDVIEILSFRSFEDFPTRTEIAFGNNPRESLSPFFLETFFVFLFEQFVALLQLLELLLVGSTFQLSVLILCLLFQIQLNSGVRFVVIRLHEGECVEWGEESVFLRIRMSDWTIENSNHSSFDFRPIRVGECCSLRRDDRVPCEH